MYDSPPTAETFLQISDLTLDADGRRLIDVPSLSLSKTGITAIMGPNGAGKSLLLRLIHGMQTPTSGTITLTPARRTHALVLQTPVLLRRSVEANLRFVLKSRGLSCERVPQLLKRVQLEHCRRSAARRLSGGECQRLAIAQALAMEPDVLLLDEPTASLDPSATHLIEETLRQIAAEGVRVVLVSHDIHQGRRLARDVVFLADGSVCEHTASQAFFDQPKTEIARAYLAGRLFA